MSIAHRVALRHLSAGKGEIVAKVPVKGQSGGGYSYDVVLRKDYYGRDELVVDVRDTPGNWYLKDFMSGRGRLAIDYGQDWWLENADDIRKAIKRMDLDNLSGGDEEKAKEIAAALKGVSRDLGRQAQKLVGELMDALRKADSNATYWEIEKEHPALAGVMTEFVKLRKGLMQARDAAFLMSGEADRVLR